MCRWAVRELKRAVNAGLRQGAVADSIVLAKESAASLLERSIRFGHGRLAIIRLRIAVQAGAAVLPEQWTYCREAAARSRDEALKALFVDAARLASARPTSHTPAH